jgi:hypothetical protein
VKTISDLIDEALAKRRTLALKYSTSLKPPPRGPYWSNLWTVYSPKLNRIITLYSNLECYVWIDLERNPEIAGFCPQPDYAYARFEGKEGRSLLDFWVIDIFNKETFLEAKYEKDLLKINSKHQLRKQIYIQEEGCKNIHQLYEIKTDKTLKPIQVVLDNWSKILTSLSSTKEIDFKTAMKSIITQLIYDGEASIKDVIGNLGEEDSFAAVSNLLSLGLIYLKEPLKRLTWLSVVMIDRNSME